MNLLKREAKRADQKMSKLYFTAISSLLLILASCDNGNSIRNYEEKAPPAKSEQQTTNTQIQWDVPEGWMQETNTSSMRLATFSIGEGNDKSVCTIVPLKGEAGGLQANVIRWLGQLKIQLQSEDELKGFLDQKDTFKTKGQFPGDLVDFTSLAKNQDDVSMLVAMVKISDITLFIKLSGRKGKLVGIRPKFEALCQSIHTGAL